VRSPLEQALPLLQVDVAKRKVVRKAVGGKVGRNMVRSMGEERLGFVAAERGLEWEQPYSSAKLPKEKLPPLQHLLRAAIMDFDLRDAHQKLMEEKRDKFYKGFNPHRHGPRLPVRRPPPAEEDEEREASMQEEVEPASDEVADFLPGFDTETPPQDEAEHLESGPSIQEMSAADEGPEDEMPFPWTDEELHVCFAKYDDDRDGEVHKGDLTAMVRYVGGRSATKEVTQLANEYTTYATLNYEEYVGFMHKFRDFDVERMRQVFNAADEDESGALDVDELCKLMQRMGYATTKQSTIEAMIALDKSRDSVISFREFEGLREYLRSTEGFLKADVAELNMLFSKAAKTGEYIVADDVWRISMYVGYAAAKQDVEVHVSEIAKDENGKTTFSELLKIIRNVRDAERGAITQVLRSHGAEDVNRIGIEDLGIALTELGYFVAEEAVFEILDNLGECESESYLTFEELLTFLRDYRRTEGFTEEELEELKEIFFREGGGEESLDTLAMGRVLRWFGYSRSVQEVQRLVDEMDFDGSGKLELIEYVKLMRRFHQTEAKKRHTIFDSLDVNRFGEIHRDQFPMAIENLQGVKPDMEIISKAMAEQKAAEEAEAGADSEQSPFLDRRAYEAVYKRFHKLVVEQVRKSGGYTPAEVVQMRALFDKFDADKSGSIERKELHKVIIEYFPEATKSKQGQKAIQDIISEVDDGNMEFDFNEFLWLMRKCDDMRDERDVKLEHEVVKECGFTPEEVDGYRQIFSANVDWVGEMKLEALTALLANVIELSPAQAEALGELVREVHPDGREAARFPQFLQLIKRLTIDNALGVNDAATRAVRREERKAKAYR